jgi:hypothetical protein
MICMLSIAWEITWDIIKSFIVPLSGSAFGAWATFEVFKRQLAANHRNQIAELTRTINEENDKQNSRAAARLSNFAWLLDDILKYATAQNEDYLKTANDISDNLMLPHRLTIRASDTISRILTLKQEDIFASFILKALDTEDNRIHIAKIYNKLDYIKKSIRSNRLKYKEHIDTYHSIGIEYRQYIENIRELFVDIVTESKRSGKYADDGFANLISKMQGFYLTSLQTLPEASNLDWHHQEFLRPMMEEFVDDYMDEPRAKPILTQGSRANKLAGRLKFSSQTTALDLKEAHKDLGNALKELNTEIKYVKAVLITT